MNEIKAIEYLRNQIALAPITLTKYSESESGNKHLPRSIFIRIKQLIRNFSKGQKELRIVAIPGLRGVGKTTLLAQLYLDTKLSKKQNIIFLSVDRLVNDLNLGLYEALECYQKILGTSFEELNEDIFLFLDEIHFDPKWPMVLKSIYDRSKRVFVVCSGSSALSLQSTADLARRVIFEPLYPMNFTEYMLLKTQYQAVSNSLIQPKFPIKGLKKQLKEALFYSSNAKESFNRLRKLASKVNQYWMNIGRLEIPKYLRFASMPYVLGVGDEIKAQILTNELINRIVEKDLRDVKAFSEETISKVRRMLLMAAASSELSATNLSKNLDKITAHTIIRVFNALEKAEVLIKVYPYGSAYKSVRKPSKYYFMSPSLRYTLLVEIKGQAAFEKYRGALLEDVAALSLYREFSRKLTSPIFYDSARGGADFILKLLEKKIVIEIGLGKKGVKQAESTLKKIKGDYGLVVAKTQLELADKIVKVPLDYFLLV